LGKDKAGKDKAGKDEAGKDEAGKDKAGKDKALICGSRIFSGVTLSLSKNR